MSLIKQILTPKQKALNINLDPSVYGTFAEIGAGQETVRHFLGQVAHLIRLQRPCLLMIKISVTRSTEKKQKQIRYPEPS